MDSSNLEPKKSASPGNESPPQKRIYLRQGILESNKDFAERFLRQMRKEGMLPLRKNRE